MSPHMQQAQQTPKQDKPRSTVRHIIAKLPEIKDKGGTLKATVEKTAALAGCLGWFGVPKGYRFDPWSGV